ncbi:MAG: hypothetical protein NW208_02070 [Bryobacter sp.]|nr:hypothetical protein [Bryobacter sp.]
MKPWQYWALLVLGSGQMLCDLAGFPPGVGLFFATAASPAPKVFSSLGDYEPFSSHFYSESLQGGTWISTQLTPEIYQRLEGPYNRRNVYGAVVAGGVELVKNPLLAPMVYSVLRFGMCPADPKLVREMHLPEGRQYRLRVLTQTIPTKVLYLEPDCSN